MNKAPTVVHHRKSHYDILIDRTTKWGNPYRTDHIITYNEALLLGDESLVGNTVTRDQCIDLFGFYLRANKELKESIIELDGKALGCWCKNADGSGKRCHGDVIVEVFIEEIINSSLFEY